MAVMLSLTLLSTLGFLLQANAQSDRPATPSDESMDNFLLSGKINSAIYTVNDTWYVQGPFALVVKDGRVSLFDVNMNWVNEDQNRGHTHQLRNFQSDDDDIELTGDRNLLIEGKMDVATNGITSWNGVDGTLNIEGGKLATISVDNEQTNGHFDDQAIYGKVLVIKPCNIKPGPSMQLPTGCF